MFNEALLEKWKWRVAIERNELCKEILLSKYED